MDKDGAIAELEDIPEKSSYVVVTENEGVEKEVVFVRVENQLYAFENHCIHWTDVKLDRGSGAEIRDNEIICKKHGAMFELDNGYCNYGPCEGGYLPKIDIEVEDGYVYLTDPDYRYISSGTLEKDDLSSRGGRDF